MNLKDVPGPLPSYIGNLNNGMVVEISSAIPKTEVPLTAYTMASGAVRTQWGQRTTTTYECTWDGATLDQAAWLKSLRLSRQRIWFIDGYAGVTNALPLSWSTISKPFWGEIKNMDGDIYTGGFTWKDISSQQLGNYGSSVIPSSLTCPGGSFTATVPAFPARDWCFSIYSQGSALQVTVGGVTSTADNSGEWERVVVSGSADTTSMDISISNISTIAGMQLTWGSTQEQLWAPGAGISTGIITEINSTYVELMDDVLSPCTFTIQELPQ